MLSWRPALTWVLGGAGVVLVVSSWACGSFAADDTRDAGGAEAGGAEAGGAEAGAADAASSNDANAGDADILDGGGGLIAFVTDVGYADITTLAAADTKCQAEANLRLPGRFVAWLSSGTTAAASRLVDSKGVPVDGPWFRADGARIVATRAALLATASVPLENGISVTATLKTMGGGVWTGTHADGGIGSLCPSASPTTGVAGQVVAAWTEQKFFTASCSSTSLALYCFQVE